MDNGPSSVQFTSFRATWTLFNVMPEFSKNKQRKNVNCFFVK